MMMLVAVVCALVAVASAQINGQDPPAGTCLCFNNRNVNIRDSACGNIIGTESFSCYKYTGNKQTCVLSGVSYEFFGFEYGARTGWSAGDYLDVGTDSQCSGASATSYTCNVPSSEYGKRIHETTTPTIYDCTDSGCGNTCQGGQCVALVTCRCTRNGAWAPGTQCWAPGAKVVNNGVCNTAIPANTAIATFNSLGNYYAGHAAVFLRCSGSSVIVVDQWCCSSIGETTYTSSSSLYNDFYVVENGGCADRSSWACRLENGGPTCCPTSVPGCLKSRQWWSPETA